MGTSQTDILTEPVLEIACSHCSYPLDVSGLPAFTEIACPECQTPQTVPTKLGSFLLVELLGKGGMGAVYRGHDTSLDRWVAIKVMLASMGENEDFLTTFRREAQAAAALNHPNVVQIYSFGMAQGQPYMVMELLEGGRLDQMIAKGEAINESLIIKIAADVVEGLNAAAAIGLIHGDVKPENILLDNNGVAKVVDFGLARFKQSKESTKGIWGTPYYIAPEKIRGSPGDARSDIYSLGGTLFHALTLKPPFDGETPIDVVKARLTQPAPQVRTLRPDVTPEVEAIVARMLEAEPARRYPTYASLLSDIRKVQSQMKPPPSAAFAPVGKKGGKIVLTRKKGGVVSPLATSSSSPLTIHVGATGLGAVAEAASTPEKKPRMKRGLKLGLIVGGGLLALLLVGGGTTWGILHHKKTVAERQAADREKARLDQVRKSAETIWAALIGAASNATVRCEATKPWLTDLTLAASAIAAATNKLTDAALITEAETNVPALTQLVSQSATGTLAGFLAELQTLTNAVGTNRVALLATTNAVQAEQILTAVTNSPAQALTIDQASRDEFGRAETAFKDLLALKKRVAAAAAEQEAAAEQAAKERAEAERKAREQAEAERLAAEKERKSQAEVKLVQDLRKTNGPLIQQNQFKQAAESLAPIGKGMESEAGKQAWKLTTERYRMLSELKTFIIAGVTAEVKANPATGYKFGWMNSKDILAADEEKVSVRGGSFTWEQVPPAQMLRFIRHYVGHPDVSRREAGRHYLAAAIYVFEAGGGSDTARKLSQEFIGEAQRASAAIESQVKQFFPD